MYHIDIALTIDDEVILIRVVFFFSIGRQRRNTEELKKLIDLLDEAVAEYNKYQLLHGMPIVIVKQEATVSNFSLFFNNEINFIRRESLFSVTVALLYIPKFSDQRVT